VEYGEGEMFPFALPDERRELNDLGAGAEDKGDHDMADVGIGRIKKGM
jgi:hypothetical protein